LISRNKLATGRDLGKPNCWRGKPPASSPVNPTIPASALCLAAQCGSFALDQYVRSWRRLPSPLSSAA